MLKITNKDLLYSTGNSAQCYVTAQRGGEFGGECETHSVVSGCVQPHGLYSPWNSPGQNTGEGSLSLLRGLFPIQGSNPGFLHCRQILYQLSHKGSPWIHVYAWRRPFTLHLIVSNYNSVICRIDLFQTFTKLKSLEMLPKGSHLCSSSLNFAWVFQNELMQKKKKTTTVKHVQSFGRIHKTLTLIHW